MTKLILTLLMIGLFSGCSVNQTKPTKVSVASLLNKDKNHVLHMLGGVNKIDEQYSFYYKGDIYSAVQYREYELLFKNKIFKKITNIGTTTYLWGNNYLPKKISHLPYLNNFPKIYSTIINAKNYSRKPISTHKKSKNSHLGASDISDALAAGTMFVVVAPILPIILATKSLDDFKNQRKNWNRKVVGSTVNNAISILGRPEFHKKLKNGDKIFYFKPRIYIGVHNEKVIWMVHKRITLDIMVRSLP